MVRSLYTSADMEKEISVTSDPVDGFQSVRGHFGVVFKTNPMDRSLYTSADMEKDISITSDPVDRFQSVWGHFGVVFQGQSSSVFKSNMKLEVMK